MKTSEKDPDVFTTRPSTRRWTLPFALLFLGCHLHSSFLQPQTSSPLPTLLETWNVFFYVYLPFSVLFNLHRRWTFPQSLLQVMYWPLFWNFSLALLSNWALTFLWQRSLLRLGFLFFSSQHERLELWLISFSSSNRSNQNAIKRQRDPGSLAATLCVTFL